VLARRGLSKRPAQTLRASAHITLMSTRERKRPLEPRVLSEPPRGTPGGLCLSGLLHSRDVSEMARHRVGAVVSRLTVLGLCLNGLGCGLGDNGTDLFAGQGAALK
jgi:hypothetical protein